MSQSATPGAVAQDNSVGTALWSPLNAASLDTNDDDKSVVTMVFGEISQYAVLTNFGFTVPGGATITGIGVDVTWRRTNVNADIRDYSIRLVRAGLLESHDKATFTNLPTSDTEWNYGPDMWSAAWTPADVNDADFGVAIAVENFALLAEGESGNAEIDRVVVSVLYDGGGTTWSPGLFQIHGRISRRPIYRR